DSFFGIENGVYFGTLEGKGGMVAAPLVQYLVNLLVEPQQVVNKLRMPLDASLVLSGGNVPLEVVKSFSQRPKVQEADGRHDDHEQRLDPVCDVERERDSHDSDEHTDDDCDRDGLPTLTPRRPSHPRRKRV